MNTVTRILIATGIAIAPLAAFADTNVTTATDASTNVSVGTPIMTTSVAGEVHASSSMREGMHGNGKGGAMALSNAINRANEEIDRRIKNLTDLSTRIGQMKNVTDSEKTSLQATITTEITNLTSLKATIDAETGTTTLKTDIQSITKDYRIYMLVIPQARIIAAADRIETIVADMQALAPKLQARISAAQSAGKDVTAANTAYADMQAKVTDANTQAAAAASEVASLTPDQGNDTTKTSNETALKDAESKIKTATADLKAARADVTTIVKAVKGTGSVTASSTTSVSGHAENQ